VCPRAGPQRGINERLWVVRPIGMVGGILGRQVRLKLKNCAASMCDGLVSGSARLGVGSQMLICDRLTG